MRRFQHVAATLGGAIILACAFGSATAEPTIPRDSPRAAERPAPTASDRVHLINGLLLSFNWARVSTREEFLYVAASMRLREIDGALAVVAQNETWVRRAGDAPNIAWSVYHVARFGDIGEIGPVVRGPPLPPRLNDEPNLAVTVYFFAVRCEGLLTLCFQTHGHYYNGETATVFETRFHQAVFSAPSYEEAETLRAAVSALIATARGEDEETLEN